jgi:hypothetical protein
LITRELWERVQGVLDGRHSKKTRKSKKDFAFARLINCGHCGCAMVGEIKKRRYIYYHCTGYKGKCPEPYVREEIIAEAFSDLLRKLSFGDEVLSWVSKALRESHADEKQEHEAAIARLQAEHDRLHHRIHAMYVDKLDGRIDKHFFGKLSGDSAPSRRAACARSRGIRLQISPTLSRASASLISPMTQGGSLPNRTHTRSGAC